MTVEDRGHRAARVLLAAALLGLITLKTAIAHIIAPQYSFFDNGALHNFLTLQQVVPLLAFGAALGGLAPTVARGHGAAFLAALTAAGLWWSLTGQSLAAYATPFAFLTGGAALISGGSRFAAWLGGLAAIVIGIQAGGAGQPEGPRGMDAAMFVLGAGLGAMLIVFYAAYAVWRFRRPWFSIPTRIAGSWLLAIGFMFLGLSLRPVPPVVDNSSIPTAACRGPHKHGPDGEFICLAKPGAAPSVMRDESPPNPDAMLPAGRRAGPSVPQ